MIALSLVVYVVPGAHGFLWGILNRVEPLISQFPEAKQLTRKDNLKRHVQRFRNIPGKLGDLFDILPNTYTLPGDYVQFCTEFAKRHEVDAG